MSNAYTCHVAVVDPCPPGNCQAHALVATAVAGNDQSWEALASNFAPLVERTVRQVFSTHLQSDCEDATQEVWIHLLQQFPQLLAGTGSARSPLCMWIRLVARRKAIDLARRRRPEHQSLDLTLASTPPSSGLMECIDTLSANLPDRTKKVLEGLKQGARVKEIAQSLGKSIHVVHREIRILRDRLQECME